MRKVRKLLTTIGVTGLMASPLFFLKQQEKVEPLPIKTEKTISKKPVVKNSVRTISYITDTLYQSTSTLMFYVRNTVYRNYVEKNNSFRMQLPYFVHEDWHKHNEWGGFRHKYLYSPMEYYKLCMHDEISANLAAILTARFEYLSSPDKAATIAKYEHTYMGFYFKAIKEGKINPESKNSEDNEKEWHFIANETRNMWMKTFAKQYSPTTLSMLKTYIEKKGFQPENPKAYNMMKSYMYTIGGVNFAKYMDADIEYEDKNLELINELGKIPSFRSMEKKFTSNILENQTILNDLPVEKRKFIDEVLANIPLLDSVPYEKKSEVIQHIFIASLLKSTINENDKPEKIRANLSIGYNKIITLFAKDRNLQDFVARYTINKILVSQQQPTEEYDSVIKKIYTYKGVDISRHIRNFTVEQVPYQFNVLYNSSMSWLGQYNMEKWNDTRASLADLRFQNESEPQAQQPRRRLSEEISIDIPNFRDPLLVAMTAEQTDELYQMLQDFENMPAVLKGCDTQAIETYKKQHGAFTMQK